MRTFNIDQISSRILDAAVLFCSFLLFSLLTGFVSQAGFLPALLLHVLVLYFSLRLGKRLVFRHLELPSPLAAILSGNLLGLLVGNLVLTGLLPLLHMGHFVVVINLIASAAAFFLLGTLSSIVKSVRNDIVAH